MIELDLVMPVRGEAAERWIPLRGMVGELVEGHRHAVAVLGGEAGVHSYRAKRSFAEAMRRRETSSGQVDARALSRRTG